ncbi:hypothetical protein CI105_01525 [Candidatus Izimaplasma bacterium ZiA1]|uniref:lipoprotein intramolecular transacylase Lit n=1 Tax=Candidatus Izimoplasma sp. ZiA1 TaxID=2024899 RepID=UPI000BAA6F48|nr:hypothetical protein CI105_01525 [Candidatus Izimaplasma bacterium ZiA1]
MKFYKFCIYVLLPFALLIVFASLLTTKQYMILSENRYESHQDITFDYDYASDRIMGYLNYKYDNLLFGETPEDDEVILYDVEIRHMVDVKNVYTGLRITAVISLILALFSIFMLRRKNKYVLFMSLKRIYRGPLALTAFLGVAFAIDFDGAFTIFHKIFFRNDDWLLPSDSVLLQLLPLNFWLVSAVSILILFVGSLFLIRFLNQKLNK